MTYLGAFEYLLSGDFTLISVTQAGRDQVTGARVNASRAQSTIKGAINLAVHDELRLYGIEQIVEGSGLFCTAESYGVKLGDLILDPSNNTQYRVLRKIEDGHLVRARMDPSSDPIVFYVERTRSGTSA